MFSYFFSTPKIDSYDRCFGSSNNLYNTSNHTLKDRMALFLQILSWLFSFFSSILLALSLSLLQRKSLFICQIWSLSKHGQRHFLSFFCFKSPVLSFFLFSFFVRSLLYPCHMTAGIKRPREKKQTSHADCNLRWRIQTRRDRRKKKKKDNQAMTARGEEKRIRESKARKMRNGWMDWVHGKVKVQG